MTAKDLAGKTFCWNNGNVAHYGADGRFVKNGVPRARWSVPEAGHLQIGYNLEEMLVLPDGRLRLHVFKIRAKKKPGGSDRYLWATACKASTAPTEEDDSQ